MHFNLLRMLTFRNCDIVIIDDHEFEYDKHYLDYHLEFIKRCMRIMSYTYSSFHFNYICKTPSR